MRQLRANLLCIGLVVLTLLWTTVAVSAPLSTQTKDAADAAQKEQQKVLGFLDGALKDLRTIYELPETPLSSKYEAVKTTLEDLVTRKGKLDAQITQFDEIAGKLFEEWRDEAATYHDQDLKKRSLVKLTGSKKLCTDILQRLMTASKSLEPLKVQLRDHELFIKHELNMRSLEKADTDLDDIEDGFQDVMKGFKDSIADTGAFIQGL